MADHLSYDQMVQTRRQAQKVLLDTIISDQYAPEQQRELAEAFALLEGTLTAQPVKLSK